MFQALKKLTSSKQDVVSPISLESATPMSGSLQKKFSRGVNYNMKLIIKGDRNVGKSCLFKRLQGGQFIETYTPTEEIQVASIQWSFKATEDIVKVEVWDVVDKGKARPKQTGLKLSTAAPIPENIALDAEFLDVYKGTHGVIIMFDITKAWTFDYVIRELPKVPADIPVLVLGNHCDMSHHRVISLGQAQDLVETALRGRTSEVIYAESSMRNGFGLRLLHKFLGLPFLRLQKETFLALVERNARDTEICRLEVVEFLNCDDANYNSFLNKLSDKRRQVADSNSRVPPTSIPISNSSISSPASPNPPGLQTPNGSNVNTQSSVLRPTKSIIVGGGQPIIIPGQINITQTLNENKPMTQNNTNNKIPESSTTKATALVSSLLRNADATQQNNFNKSNNNITVEVRKLSIVDQNQKLSSLEEFCPDDGGNLDRNFLDDIPNVKSENILGGNSASNTNNNGDSDSDNDTVNPLVARFYDEPENTGFGSNDLKTLKSSNFSEQQKPTINTTKINPLAKGKNKTIGPDSADFLKLDKLRKNSYSSEEIPSASPDESHSHQNIQEFEENLDSWLTDTSIRRSPEGGEDTGSVPSISQDMNSSSEMSKISNQEKKSSSHKKKKEKKDRDKDKDRSEKKERKKKKRTKANELEDFLNGTDDTNRIEEAYEAI